MILAITLPTSLFIFFLLLAFIIGILVMMFAATSAIKASYNEPTREEIREQFHRNETPVRMFFKDSKG